MNINWDNLYHSIIAGELDGYYPSCLKDIGKKLVSLVPLLLGLPVATVMTVVGWWWDGVFRSTRKIEVDNVFSIASNYVFAFTSRECLKVDFDNP